jgi:outer membrane PBP1 activator LpoA protein
MGCQLPTLIVTGLMLLTAAYTASQAHPGHQLRLEQINHRLAQPEPTAAWLIRKAMALADSGQPDLARQSLQTISPADHHLHSVLLAALYLKLGDDELARELLHNWLNTNAERTPAEATRVHLMLAQMADRADQPITAANHQILALRLNPEPPAHQFWLTLQAIEQAGLSHDLYLEQLQQGLARHPGYLPLLELNIRLATNRQDQPARQQAIKRLLKRYPQHPHWAAQSAKHHEDV